eukprot:CAMPEP_0197714766 /NCGR_PEP_ID=MMETSP1338-20131121/131125_1 /TAXON_ID=43686 ORGANISM="Pelagodinium beii, Strain RCC1491" /NCGR_SAMPLE_ID=MMETSP1338 /ASSEMBLY_ACC=CAM_ASM_000754 /LENGTH=194 /DNA_ID=CAMNT_0043298709 /DNA_START=294 /DNA_END=878 /DNA_ORIENTATION=-
MPRESAGVLTSCFWKFRQKSPSIRYRSACRLLKKPQDGGRSFPSAMALISDSFTMQIRRVGRGVLVMSVKVHVSMLLLVAAILFFSLGVLFSGLVGVIRVTQLSKKGTHCIETRLEDVIPFLSWNPSRHEAVVTVPVTLHGARTQNLHQVRVASQHLLGRDLEERTLLDAAQIEEVLCRYEAALDEIEVNVWCS